MVSSHTFSETFYGARKLYSKFYIFRQGFKYKLLILYLRKAWFPAPTLAFIIQSENLALFMVGINRALHRHKGENGYKVSVKNSYGSFETI